VHPEFLTLKTFTIMTLIKKPNEIQFALNIKTLLYGQPGIGKTTLGLSAPSPLILDCDRGIHRISPQHLKDTVPVEKWEDIDAVLKEDLSAYQTLVVDTAGKMIELMSDYIMRQDPRMRMGDGSLSLKGYGARKVMFKSLFSRVSLLGKNLVFIAHEHEERDGDTRFVRPEIGGSSGNDLMKELDLVGYMEAVGKKRTISFDATEKYYGKNTCSLPERIEVPDAVTSGNNLLTTIFIQYKDMLDKKTQMKMAYNKKLDEVESIVENADTLEKINEAIVTFKNMEHLWDSKIQASHKLNNKAKAVERLQATTPRRRGGRVVAVPDAEVAQLPQPVITVSERGTNSEPLPGHPF
jgi:hypothetical protein